MFIQTGMYSGSITLSNLSLIEGSSDHPLISLSSVEVLRGEFAAA